MADLRVVDASELPIMISGKLNGTVMATASRTADLILGDAGSSRTRVVVE